MVELASVRAVKQFISEISSNGLGTGRTNVGAIRGVLTCGLYITRANVSGRFDEKLKFAYLIDGFLGGCRARIQKPGASSMLELRFCV